MWTGATGLGHFRMWRALLAATLDLDERADADFAFACEFQETNGMLFWAAYAHVLWGEAFATRGESGARKPRALAARACPRARLWRGGGAGGRACLERDDCLARGLTRSEGPWRNADHVEWATLTYVDWFNTRRIHNEIGKIPSAELEGRFTFVDPPGTTITYENPLRLKDGARFATITFDPHRSGVTL